MATTGFGSTAAAGAAEPVREALSHPTLRYAAARERAQNRLDLPLLKFGAFALVPAVPLFRLHQWVSYGGTFGEYHAFGLKAYLLGFGLYWLLSATYLLLFAAALRARFPSLPMEEEGRLGDPGLRENFVERLFAYRRVRRLFASRWTVGDLVRFHTAEKLLLLALMSPWPVID